LCVSIARFVIINELHYFVHLELGIILASFFSSFAACFAGDLHGFSIVVCGVTGDFACNHALATIGCQCLCTQSYNGVLCNAPCLFVQHLPQAKDLAQQQAACYVVA
jgi:hypothetical protein